MKWNWLELCNVHCSNKKDSSLSVYPPLNVHHSTPGIKPEEEIDEDDDDVFEPIEDSSKKLSPKSQPKRRSFSLSSLKDKEEKALKVTIKF